MDTKKGIEKGKEYYEVMLLDRVNYGWVKI